MTLLTTVHEHFTPPSQPSGGPGRQGLTLATDRVKLSDLTRLLTGTKADAPRDPEENLALTLWQVRRHATLLHEGFPGMALYVVRSGSLKCLRTLEDGYEQVLSFVQRGELLGFEALHSGRQRVSVVALEDSTLYGIQLRHLPGLRQRCSTLDNALYFALSRQLGRLTDSAEMMAAVASDVRLSRFLLWMSAELAHSGQSPKRILLRMGRRDIASFLGVAHETVSRSFSSLADKGCIEVNNRAVKILDIDQLKAHASCTRGLDDSPCARPSFDAPREAAYHRPAASA